MDSFGGGGLRGVESLTDEHVLVAYADGADLDDVAPTLRATFARFAGSGAWPSGELQLVDLRQPIDPAEPEFLPKWDLGLNLGLDHRPGSPNWFAAVESLVAVLRQLAADTGREFVLFVCFRSEPWRQEHLAFVGPGLVDLAWLREAINRLTVRRGAETPDAEPPDGPTDLNPNESPGTALSKNKG
jgi:hypothetical protein